MRASLVALLATLTLVASAAAAPNEDSPVLLVAAADSTPGRAVDLGVLAYAGSLGAASLTLYVPRGYLLAGDLPVGSRIGTIALSTGESPPAEQDLLIAAPDAYARDPRAQSCAAGPHLAVFDFSWQSGGYPRRIPVFADRTRADEVPASELKLTLCPPSPYVPADQGGAPAKFPLLLVSLELDGIVSNPPSARVAVWRALVTPYEQGTDAAEPERTFELRARVPVPNALRAKAIYFRRTQTLAVNGRVLAGGKPRAGLPVAVYVERSSGFAADEDELGVAETRRDGTFSIQVTALQRRKRQELRLAAAAEFVLGPCTGAPTQGTACVSESFTPPRPRVFRALIPAKLSAGANRR